MPLIRLSTFIRAAPAVCFDLARSIDLHAAAPGPLGHRAVGGVTRGLIGPGEEVTWEAALLGVRLHMTSKIVAFERPRAFTDEMRRGPFARWRHAHSFEPSGGGTLMHDAAEFASPLGPLGRVADALVLGSFMRRLLVAQNRFIRDAAEGRNDFLQRFAPTI
ncbi:MAG TPA: SRPBCC family protein [Pyrinomonadaceae bacterium]|nr:SRPBCC family protein [Pyrinomonadaceae bacterium]